MGLVIDACLDGHLVTIDLIRTYMGKTDVFSFSDVYDTDEILITKTCTENSETS